MLLLTIICRQQNAHQVSALFIMIQLTLFCMGEPRTPLMSHCYLHGSSDGRVSRYSPPLNISTNVYIQYIHDTKRITPTDIGDASNFHLVLSSSRVVK